MTIIHYAIFPKYTLYFQEINSLRFVCVLYVYADGRRAIYKGFQGNGVRYHTTSP